MELDTSEILCLFFYLNLSALQMKESLESLRDHKNYNCQLEIRHELRHISSWRVPVSIRLTSV